MPITREIVMQNGKVLENGNVELLLECGHFLTVNLKMTELIGRRFTPETEVVGVAGCWECRP